MYDTWYVSCEHIVRIQYVREYNDRLGINMNTKPFVIFRCKVVHYKKSQLPKYGDIDLVVAQADLVQQHHHYPPQSDHTAVGRIAASTTCCLCTTSALCSTWYNCCCLLLLYHRYNCCCLLLLYHKKKI